MSSDSWEQQTKEMAADRAVCNDNSRQHKQTEDKDVLMNVRHSWGEWTFDATEEISTVNCIAEIQTEAWLVLFILGSANS